MHILLVPSPKKSVLALTAAILVPTLDKVFSFCAEDMCFNGIYRISGPENYFLAGNIMRYSIEILLLYALINIIAYAFLKK